VGGVLEVQLGSLGNQFGRLFGASWRPVVIQEDICLLLADVQVSTLKAFQNGHLLLAGRRPSVHFESVSKWTFAPCHPWATWSWLLFKLSVGPFGVLHGLLWGFHGHPWDVTAQPWVWLRMRSRRFSNHTPRPTCKTILDMNVPNASHTRPRVCTILIDT
jgi:hypothetical protein